MDIVFYENGNPVNQMSKWENSSYVPKVGDKVVFTDGYADGNIARTIMEVFHFSWKIVCIVGMHEEYKYF